MTIVNHPKIDPAALNIATKMIAFKEQGGDHPWMILLYAPAGKLSKSKKDQKVYSAYALSGEQLDILISVFGFTMDYMDPFYRSYKKD